VSAELIDFSDMLPTIAQVGGATVPAALNIDGRSFAPLIRGDKYRSQDWIYCWYSRHGVRGKEKQLTRNDTYKLYSDGKFYNVIDDFFEKTPLSVGSLSDKQRGSYDLLKTELDKQLIVTAKATEEIKKRIPAKKKKKPNDKNKKKPKDKKK
jgi:arylsulfatase A